MSLSKRVEALEDAMKIIAEGGTARIILPINFIGRICKWNEVKYKQEFNADLTQSLLREEVKELFEAPKEVDALDALVDIIYVSIGAIWKMGLSSEQISEAIYAVCDANDTKSIVKTPSHIKTNINKGEYFIPPEKRLQEILNER